MALLVPSTGAPAGLAERMRSAAEPVAGQPYKLEIFDTRGTSVGATEAARRAIDVGAAVILGPVFTHEVSPVVEVAGSVPVITFSNDGDLVGGGAFVFGVTPAQSIATIFAFARAQGVRRVAVVAYSGAWGRQSVAAARLLAPRAGLTFQQAITVDGADDPTRVLSQLRRGEMPDAVLLADGGTALAVLGQSLAGSGVQVLGTSQWGDLDLASVPSLRGAWYAAPDPIGINSVLAANPGVKMPSLLTALAHDAATIAATLAAEGKFSRTALQRPDGFPAALGRVRFASDGSVERDLAVLGVSATGANLLSRST